MSEQRPFDEVFADLIADGSEDIRRLDGRHIRSIAIYVDRLKAELAEAYAEIENLRDAL